LKFLLFFVLICSVGFCNDTTFKKFPKHLDYSFERLRPKSNLGVYWAYGITGLCPSVGIGMRTDQDDHNFDLYASFGFAGIAYAADVSISFLLGNEYFIGPSLGGGVDAVAFFRAGPYATGKIAMGKKLSEENLIQFDVGLRVPFESYEKVGLTADLKIVNRF